MNTIGIAVDEWKVTTFIKHLREAGYEPDQTPVDSAGIIMLRVKAKHPADIQPIVQAAEKECQAS